MAKDVSSLRIEAPLRAEEAAPVLEAEQALALVPVEEKALTQQETKATAYLQGLLQLQPQDPAFTRKVEEVYTLGEQEIKATGLVSSRLLDRPMGGGSGGSPQYKVAQSLGELREQITELDPNRADLRGAKKLLKFLPGGNSLERYMNKYASARSHLEAITEALTTGQDNLRRDNADLEGLQQAMFEAMTKLRLYDALLQGLDTVVARKVAEAAGDQEVVKALESDLLFAVRQRRMDVQTQLAVGVQGYLAIDLVRKNNLELIRGVERAKSTTMAAMQTAIVVAQALDMQELVLGQVNRLNDATGEMLASTSRRLKDQGSEIQRQASTSMIQVEKLQEAFDNVFTAMDQVDNFHREANQTMAETIGNLETQVARAKPYLDRSQGRPSSQGH